MTEVISSITEYVNLVNSQNQFNDLKESKEFKKIASCSNQIYKPCCTNAKVKAACEEIYYNHILKISENEDYVLKLKYLLGVAKIIFEFNHSEEALDITI